MPMSVKHINLKTLSPNELLRFGINHIAYIKETEIDGNVAYAVHGADGSPLYISQTKDAALSGIYFGELSVVSLH